MAERKTIQIPIGGMYAAGDPSFMPEGATREVRNAVFRPGRVQGRPATTSDGVNFAEGIALWDDHANRVQRVVSFTNTGTLDAQIKDTSGEGYGATITGPALSSGYVAAFTNYRGVLYYTYASGVTATALPGGLNSLDGSTIKQYPLGGETLYSLTLASFIDRLFLGYVRASVENQLGTTVAYDPTGWTLVTATGENITNGSTITGRLTPTATTNAQAYKRDAYTVAASTTQTTLVFLSQFRGVSPTYAMPLTCEIYYSQIWVTATAYTVGAIRVPTTATGNGFRYRCTVAGTSGGGEPTWPTTVGTTVADGTATWVCDGPDAIGSTPLSVLPITDSPNFVSYVTRATIPPMPASSAVGVRIKFGTTASPTITLAPIDISFKDGLTDGDLRKENRGQQLTVGKFAYPFFNQQSSATATVDLDNDIYWTEASDPNTIRGDAYYRLRDVPGKVTAMATVSGRLVVFKRRGMWIFQPTEDPNNPIVLERFIDGVGCVGPRCVTVFEDRLYFVGENEVYAFRVGSEPEPLCGDGVRETVITHDASASRDSGGSPSNIPFIAADAGQRDLWVGTRSNTTYIRDLDSGAWSTQVTSPSTSGHAVWSATTGNMYMLTDFGIGGIVTVRTSEASEESSSTYIVTRPLGTLFPRTDLVLEELGIHHLNTTARTFTVSVSLDGGFTFTKSNSFTLPAADSATVSKRTVIPLRQTGANLVLKIAGTHTGKANFAISGIDATVRVLRPERTKSTPTQGSASL